MAHTTSQPPPRLPLLAANKSLPDLQKSAFWLHSSDSSENSDSTDSSSDSSDSSYLIYKKNHILHCPCPGLVGQIRDEPARRECIGERGYNIYLIEKD